MVGGTRADLGEKAKKIYKRLFSREGKHRILRENAQISTRRSNSKHIEGSGRSTRRSI